MQQQQQQQQNHMHATTTTTIKKKYLHLELSLAIAPILPLLCGQDGYSFSFMCGFAFLHHPIDDSYH